LKEKCSLLQGDVAAAAAEERNPPLISVIGVSQFTTKLITGDLQVSQLIYLIKPYFSCTQTSVGTPHLKTLVRCVYFLLCFLTGLLAFFVLLYFSLVYVYPVFQHFCILTCILTIFPFTIFNPLNTELNPTCHLLASLGAHHILHVSGLRVNKP